MDSPGHEEKGTNVSGKSGGFDEYLNDGSADEESHKLELIRLDADTDVSIRGDDEALSLKSAY